MPVADYNSDPNLNTSISGTNIAEGCPPSGINNAIRQIMADIKTADGGYVKNSGSQTISGNAVFSSGVTIKGGAIVSGGMIVSGTISGTCTSATNAASAGVATKIGTATVGTTNKPVYISAGIPVSMAVVASATNATSAGVATKVGTATVGSTNKPVYISAGIPVSMAVVASATAATNATNATNATSATTATNALSLGGVTANSYVKTSSDQTIGGQKTFTTSPVTTGAYLIKTGLTLGTAGTENNYFSYTDKNIAKSLGNMQFHAASTWYALRLMLRKITDTSTSDSSLASVGFSVSNSNVYSFQPFQSGTTLGANSSSSRWGQIYSSSTTISTSDERAKTDIEDIPDSVLNAWGEVKWKQFKFIDAVETKGANARLHNGLIAQRIDEVFTAHGLDACQYGLFCYDEWEAEPEQRDKDGNIIEKARPAGNIYSLRYEECLCMEAAYQRRRADRAEVRLADIERRLAALETAE